MKFCQPDLCPACSLAEDKPACLRQKAEFCLWLAARMSNRGLRTPVEKMRLELLEEGDTFAKNGATNSPAYRNYRSCRRNDRVSRSEHLLVAQSRPPNALNQCPLSGVKRTWTEWSEMSASRCNKQKVRGRMSPAHTFCFAWRCRLSFLCHWLFPDAALARFRHEEQAEHEADRRDRDRVDQRVSKAARRSVSGRGDEGH